MKLIDPETNSRAINVKPISKVSKAPGDSENRKDSIHSCVARLLRSRFPAAVRGTIIPIVVNPSKCHVGSRFSHIRQKVFEFLPSGAHSDSATPVVSKGFHVRISATSKHGAPCCICLGKVSTPSVPVSHWADVAATTCLGVVAPNVIKANDRSATAIASAKHPALNAAVRGYSGRRFSEDFQLSKAATLNEDVNRHNIPSNVVFSGAPAPTGVLRLFQSDLKTSIIL